MARFLPCIVWLLQVSSYSIIVTEARPDRESSAKTKKEDSVSQSEREIVIPEECKKLGICEEVPNYPEEVVSNIIKKIESRNITAIFNKDVIEYPEVNNRYGFLEKTELCNSRDLLYAPRGALDEQQDFYIIVNDKQNPQQKFRVQLCPPESYCSSVAYFSNGYEGRCIQKYMSRQMVAVKNNKEIVKHFRVPSVCSCVAVSLQR